MFLYEAKQILGKFFLLRSRSHENSKKGLSRCNFSENFVQVQSWMHSNVKLLYLLLRFFPSSSASPSSLLKVPNVKKRRQAKYKFLKIKSMSYTCALMRYNKTSRGPYSQPDVRRNISYHYYYYYMYTPQITTFKRVYMQLLFLVVAVSK